MYPYLVLASVKLLVGLSTGRAVHGSCVIVQYGVINCSKQRGLTAVLEPSVVYSECACFDGLPAASGCHSHPHTTPWLLLFQYFECVSDNHCVVRFFFILLYCSATYLRARLLPPQTVSLLKNHRRRVIVHFCTRHVLLSRDLPRIVLVLDVREEQPICVCICHLVI